MKVISRRGFIKTFAAGRAALGLNHVVPSFAAELSGKILDPNNKAVVSIVRIKNDNVDNRMIS